MFLLHQIEYLHQCVLQTTLYMAVYCHVELHQRHTKQKGLYKSNTEENKDRKKSIRTENQGKFN